MNDRLARFSMALACLLGSALFAGGPTYDQAVLEDGPLYFWSFDEAGDLEEAVNLQAPSKAEDRLVPQGAATRVDHEAIDSDSILGRCADFDGTQGSRFFAAELGGGGTLPGSDLIPSQLWVMEFWFRVEGSTAGERADYLMESVSPWAVNDPGLIYDFTPDDYLEMYTGQRTGTAGPQVADDTWHHIVFAFYGNSGGFGVANRRDMVLDGTTYTDVDSAFSSGFSLVELALGNTVAGGGQNGFEGLMDEVAIYDVGTKLAESGLDISVQNAEAEAEFEAFVAEIAGHVDLATQAGYGDAVLAAGPLFYWTFNEAGDTDGAVNAADPEDPRDVLAAQGAATRASHATLGSGLLLGRAADFDGANGTRFYAPNIDGSGVPAVANHIESGLWALEFWFQVKGSVEGNRADYFVESIGEGLTNNPGIIYDFTADDHIEFFGPGGRTGTAGPQASDDLWHHIVFGYYGNTTGGGVANRRDIVIDGRTFTDTESGFNSLFALSQFAVGNTVADGGVNGFEGRIDEMAIYDVGAKLAEQGLDLTAQNAAAEAAFEAIIRDISNHRTLVATVCEEEADSVAISGPAEGPLGEPGIALAATFTGAEAGSQVSYAWSIVGGAATLTPTGAAATVSATEAGQVTVEVAADDGACPELGTVKSRHAICFETPDSVTISGPTQASVGEAVPLAAELSGLDSVAFVERESGFSSSFGLTEFSVGNSTVGGGVDGFDGRIDEVALYDVGTMLALEGEDLSVQNPTAEAAFAAVVRRIAEHATLGGQDYADTVLEEEPLFYWNFDEAGDLDAALNIAEPEDANDELAPQGTAIRVDHDSIGSGLDLGRCADFDGSFGSRFHALDLNGAGGGPGIDFVASRLWVLEFWFQVKGSAEGNRNDYFFEVLGPDTVPNNPGIIYDFTQDGFLEFFGPGGRTGTAGPQMRDGAWHHAVFAFYGDSAGLGAANRREIIIDGGDFAHYSWSVVAGDATVTDKGGGTAEVVGNAEGEVVVRVEAGDSTCLDASDEHTIVVGGGTIIFHRGDANGDGNMNITDGIFVLNYLFLGGPEPGCLEAANANNDDSINITDGIYILNYLFLGGPAPLPPGPPDQPCGPDTGVDLGCASYAHCGG